MYQCSFLRSGRVFTGPQKVHWTGVYQVHHDVSYMDVLFFGPLSTDFHEDVFFESLDFHGTFLDGLGAEMVDFTSRYCDFMGIWWGHHGRYSAIWYGCVMMCPDMESPRCYFPDEKSFNIGIKLRANSGGLSMNNRDFINIRNGHTVDDS